MAYTQVYEITFVVYSAFHQHFDSDVYICVLCVQLIAQLWSHTDTCSAEISRGTNTEEAFILCDVTTKMLVKCRIVDFITPIEKSQSS